MERWVHVDAGDPSPGCWVKEMKQTTFECLKGKKFESIASVDEYLNREKVECLVCGRLFKSLNRHTAMHGLTSREYKVALNIPVGRMIAGTRTRTVFSEAHKTPSAIATMLDPGIRRRAIALAKQTTPVLVPLTIKTRNQKIQSLNNHKTAAKKTRRIIDAYDSLYSARSEGEIGR